MIQNNPPSITLSYGWGISIELEVPAWEIGFDRDGIVLFPVTI